MNHSAIRHDPLCRRPAPRHPNRATPRTQGPPRLTAALRFAEAVASTSFFHRRDVGSWSVSCAWACALNGSAWLISLWLDRMARKAFIASRRGAQEDGDGLPSLKGAAAAGGGDGGSSSSKGRSKCE